MRTRRRTQVERLAARGDVRRLVRLLGAHDWLVDRDGRACDLAVGRRLEAVDALGSMRGDDAEQGLLVALADDDPRVVRAAVDALRPTPGPRTAKALAAAAATWRDPARSSARTAALDLLTSLDDEVLAVVFAETLVEEADGDLTPHEQAALRVLFDIEQGHGTTVLAERLAHRIGATDEPERRRAHQTLVALRSAAVPPLLDALRDPARRDAACDALAMIRDVRPVPILLSMLERGDARERVLAARTLGAIRDPRALDALRAAANDAEPDVRDAALDALDRLGGMVKTLGTAVVADSSERHTDPRPAAADLSAGDPHEPEQALWQRRLLERLRRRPTS